MPFYAFAIYQYPTKTQVQLRPPKGGSVGLDGGFVKEVNAHKQIKSCAAVVSGYATVIGEVVQLENFEAAKAHLAALRIKHNAQQ